MLNLFIDHHFFAKLYPSCATSVPIPVSCTNWDYSRRWATGLFSLIPIIARLLWTNSRPKSDKPVSAGNKSKPLKTIPNSMGLLWIARWRSIPPSSTPLPATKTTNLRSCRHKSPSCSSDAGVDHNEGKQPRPLDLTIDICQIGKWCNSFWQIVT